MRTLPVAVRRFIRCCIPLVSLGQFSEDADILASLAYFQEQPSKVCPETASWTIGMCAECYSRDAVY